MKDSMRSPWIAGDFGAIAREIGAPEAEAFVARMALEPGARVLDIACGTGNVTIPLARRGAMVTGLDMMPHLLEEARGRAAREGLRIRFDEGFAETLPYPDGSGAKRPPHWAGQNRSTSRCLNGNNRPAST